MKALKNTYHPIDCSFHDILLDRATLRKRVKVIYQDSDSSQSVDAIIKDVYTQKGEEFMLLDTGEIIRLDYIISVDGIALPTDATCAVK